MNSRLTIRDIAQMKRRGQAIAMLTAYDYPTAALLDGAGVDMLLVGDSLGNVVLGYESTVPVTLEEMLHHTRAVVRGSGRALVVADLPFLTYQVSPEQAMVSAGRLLKEGGAGAVKLEGGTEMAATVARLVAAGIPVMGHLGFTPQSVHALGGPRVQGKDPEAARRMQAGARALQEAGAFAVVLEMVPAPLAAEIARELVIPVIGIGAGVGCDGQVLVVHDLLGLYQGPTPRFVKQYADLGSQVRQAVASYVGEVRERRFPEARHSYGADQGSPTAAQEVGH